MLVQSPLCPHDNGIKYPVLITLGYEKSLKQTLLESSGFKGDSHISFPILTYFIELYSSTDDSAIVSSVLLRGLKLYWESFSLTARLTFFLK